jgi:hypothetical protein
MQMPAFSRTYSYATEVRGFWARPRTTFTITGFNVPNEQNQDYGPERLVLHDPGTTAAEQLHVTAADTKFLGSGPVGTTLTPTAPIVVQQGTWFGVLGACHDATGTTMHNSYDGLDGRQTTTVGSPDLVCRLTANMASIFNATGHRLASLRDLGPDRPRRLSTSRATCRARSRPRRLGRHALLRRQPAARHDRLDPRRAGGPPRRSLGRACRRRIPTPFGGLLISPSFLLTSRRRTAPAPSSCRSPTTRTSPTPTSTGRASSSTSPTTSTA